MVLLDANALMIPGRFRVDLFEEIRGLVGAFEPVVLREVVQELAGLSRAKGRDGAAARFGLAMAERCAIQEPDPTASGTVDDRIVAFAIRHGCLVVTNDRGVRDRLFEQGIGVISMRNQKKMEILRR